MWSEMETKKDPGGKKGRETHRDQEGQFSLISAINITSFSYMSSRKSEKISKKYIFSHFGLTFCLKSVIFIE